MHETQRLGPAIVVGRTCLSPYNSKQTSPPPFDSQYTLQQAVHETNNAIRDCMPRSIEPPKAFPGLAERLLVSQPFCNTATTGHLCSQQRTLSRRTTVLDPI